MDDMTGRPDFQYNMGALRVEIRLHDVDTEAPAATQLDLRAFLDYLQPNSETPMSAMVSSLLQAIPEQDSDQKEATLMRLSNFCIHAAQRIHYAHPSQLKLARLLQQVAQSPKTVTDGVPLGILGRCLRDNLTSPGEMGPSAWVNFHSFAAKLEAWIWCPRIKPTWAIWAMRDAFEERDAYYESDEVRYAYVLAAAQYVLYRGQDIIQHMACPGVVSDDDKQHWKAGPKYSGPASLSPERWCFWRDGFRAAAASEAAPGEVKNVVERAVMLMAALHAASLGLQ